MEASLKRIASAALPHGGLLCISRGSVVTFGQGTGWDRSRVAIVNAANRGGLGGGGVDGAITEAGGRALANARKALPTKRARSGGRYRIETGNAVTTGPNEAFGTYAGVIIHAVGPNYRMRDSVEESDTLLASAYESAMLRAEELELPYVGFSLISAGVFRGNRSVADVLRIGLEAVARNSYQGLREVHLCGFTALECETLSSLMISIPEISTASTSMCAK